MTFSFDMAEDPSRFDEAVEAFTSRRVVTREEADTLEGYARQRVWWISGVVQMDIVNDAHASLLKAMDEGISFEDWKREIGPKLEAAWGHRDAHRLRTIYTNATHFSYAAGRERQQRDPAVAALRPYFEFVAVEDLSECEICAACDGVVLPIDHPWWGTHSPLMHHLCRCQKRSLRAKTALATGVTQAPPEVAAGDGFGLPPDISEPPKPVERDKPPAYEVHSELYLKQLQDSKRRKPRKIALKATHDPEHWIEHFSKTYSDPEVARKLAYGRAALERSKDLTPKEALAELNRLEGLGLRVNFLRNALTEAIRYPKTAIPEHVEAAKLLAQHAKLMRGGNILPELDIESRHECVVAGHREIKTFYEALSSPKLKLPTVRVGLNGSKWRSHYKVGENRIALSPLKQHGTAVHEFGHAIEARNPDISRAARSFLKIRVGGDELVSLRELFPDADYSREEYTRPDKFYKAYMGKSYLGDATEITSVLVGDLAAGRLHHMLEKDPDSVFFILGILAGY